MAEVFVESNQSEQRSGVSLTHTQTHSHTHTHSAHPPIKLARSAVVGLRGWHSWQCPSTLGTIALLPSQSQPTLITFKFTKLYWQDERGHCCLPSCWENKYNADLSQGSGFPVDPVQVRCSVMSEKCTRKNVSLFSVISSLLPSLSTFLVLITRHYI